MSVLHEMSGVRETLGCMERMAPRSTRDRCEPGLGRLPARRMMAGGTHQNRGRCGLPGRRLFLGSDTQGAGGGVATHDQTTGLTRREGRDLDLIGMAASRSLPERPQREAA